MKCFCINYFLFAILVSVALSYQTHCPLKRSKMMLSYEQKIVTAPEVTKSRIFSIASVFTAILAVPVVARAAPKYLSEPTSEFRDEEKREKEFQAQQLKIRKDWDDILDKFLASNEPEPLQKGLNDLTAMMQKIEGIPVGVKKLELVKIIRKKKGYLEGRKQIKYPYWTKDVEIAYQSMILEFNKRLVPNNKVENPF